MSCSLFISVSSWSKFSSVSLRVSRIFSNGVSVANRRWPARLRCSLRDRSSYSSVIFCKNCFTLGLANVRPANSSFQALELFSLELVCSIWRKLWYVMRDRVLLRTRGILLKRVASNMTRVGWFIYTQGSRTLNSTRRHRLA